MKKYINEAFEKFKAEAIPFVSSPQELEFIRNVYYTASITMFNNFLYEDEPNENDSIEFYEAVMNEVEEYQSELETEMERLNKEKH